METFYLMEKQSEFKWKRKDSDVIIVLVGIFLAKRVKDADVSQAGESFKKEEKVWLVDKSVENEGLCFSYEV